MQFLRPATSIAFSGLLALLAATASAAPDAARPAGDVQPQANPIVTATRQNAFTIPFRIEPVQNPAQQPVEVQLHVSTDQGAKWEPSGRVKPDKGAFVFRAPRDGEYWFSIRTVDAQGSARPDVPLQAQLQVTVDTIAPRLELTALRGEGGEIVARWQAVDPHLKASTFKLEYQINSAGNWERVAVDAPSEAMRHTLSGETRFWPKEAGATILVRAEISDTAGNPAINQAIVKADAGPPHAGPPQGSGTQPNITQPAGMPPGSLPVSSALGGNSPNPADPKSGGTRWPAERLTGEPLGRSLGGDTGDAAWRNSNTNGTAQPVSRSNRSGRGSFDTSAPADGQRPRMVNGRSFELEYEIDSVGPSGISKVELWGTRDGGRTWSSFGIDTDNRSPIAVAVDGEGTYGFRVVVQSGNGLGGRPPAAGDVPDIWIGVDLTRPVCRITSADVEVATSELVIKWTASDELPEARPIALSYSAAPQGPWTPIASGLENTGSYRWRLDARVPDPVYLRLEMRDEAGNVGAFETAEPVSLDRHRPEGRIRGVRPLGQ